MAAYHLGRPSYGRDNPLHSGMGHKNRPCPLADNGIYSPVSITVRACPCNPFREGVAFSLRGIFSNNPLLGAVLLAFVLQMATIYVPFLNPVFKTEPLTMSELILSLALSTVVFFAVEVEKYFKRRGDEEVYQ